VPDYTSFCPVSIATSVLGDRWTPLVLREFFHGSTRFNDLARGLPGMSRSILTQRLKHLERKGVIERWPLPSGRGFEYRLTPAGADLERVIMAFGQWAIEWLFDEIQPHEVDAVTLTWWMQRRMDLTSLPTDRVVLQLDHTAPERVTLWLVIDHGEVSVCLQHPGLETDVLVSASTPTLAEVFQGYDQWRDAVAAGRIQIDGPRHLVRAVPRWFLWSALVSETRERLARERAGSLMPSAV